MSIKETLVQQLNMAIDTLHTFSGVPSDQARANVAALAVICHDAEVLSTQGLNVLMQCIELSPTRVKYTVKLGPELNDRTFESIGGGLYLEVHPVTKEVLNYEISYTINDLESISTMLESVLKVTPFDVLLVDRN